MLNNLRAFNRTHRLIEKGDTIVCAVSGGADSMALLWSLYLLKEEWDLNLSAAHFNHHLRGEESQRDEDFVRDFCAGYGKSGGENRVQVVGEISRSLKIMAKELNVPVICLSQLSRAVESRTDKRPILSDLRESGAIEQDADSVMFLYRDEYYHENTEEKGIAECIVAKNRHGETGTVKLQWIGQYQTFADREWKHAE